MSLPRAVRPRARHVGVVASALVLVGCGSQASSTVQPGTSTADVSPSTPPSISLGPGTSPAAAKAVAAAFTEFFAGTTSVDRKTALVQDGQGFAAVIQAQAGGEMSRSTTVTVSGVTLASPSRASVRYTILLGGVPALQNQTGAAVKENGHWLVGAATFCQLLTLEQSAPPLCKTV